MTFEAFAGAEAGSAGGPGSGVYLGNTNDSIIASPGGLLGAFSYQIDPVNGVPVLETYGFEAPLPDTPKFLTVMSMYRFEDDFDVAIAIAELGGTVAGQPFARRLIQNNQEEIGIVDKDEDEIGTAGNNPYLIADTDYWLLWYIDLREPTMTRDILWVYRPAVTVGAATDIAFVDGGAGADTITQVAAGFNPFIAGDVITVAGSASNDGTYTVVSRVAGTITLATGVLTAEGAGASVTITTSARWDKPVDVSGHESGSGGGGSLDSIVRLTFGTAVGKGLPTTGGPFYVDEMCAQVLNKSPNTTAIASVTTKILAPTANGTDGDFNTGTGTNPDWNDVKEVPPDGATSYDEGDVTGDKQSYAVANPGETPLAVQVVGQAERTGAAGMAVRAYILENGTRDNSVTWQHSASYRALRSGSVRPKTYNEINSQAITESIVNGSEVGVELVSVSAGRTLRLSQICLEYIIEGPQSLPSDFPAAGVATVVPGSMGVALGSANVGLF